MLQCPSQRSELISLYRSQGCPTFRRDLLVRSVFRRDALVASVATGRSSPLRRARQACPSNLPFGGTCLSCPQNLLSCIDHKSTNPRVTFWKSLPAGSFGQWWIPHPHFRWNGKHWRDADSCQRRKRVTCFGKAKNSEVWPHVPHDPSRRSQIASYNEAWVILQSARHRCESEIESALSD